MRTGLSAIAAVVVLLFVAGGAEAGKFEFKSAKVTVEVPKGWATQDEGGTVTFTTKDQMLAINLAYAVGMSVDDAWDLMIAESQKVVAGFSAEKKAGVLGTLSTGYVGSGAGSMGGASVEALVAVFPVPGGSMTVFVLGAVGKYEKHEKAMAKFLDSLTPVFQISSDDQLTQVPADGQKVAHQIAAAIGKNDSKAFLKLLGKKGIGFSDGGSSVVVKTAKVKGAIKKAGSVAAFVGLPASGEFHVLFDAETGTSFSIYRGAQSGVVTYVHVTKDKKKWVIDGTWMQDHGTD
jgi:hypothetical protein